MEILSNVVIVLTTVILTLVALIRFYLPRHDRQMHNPWAEQLLNEIRQMREADLQHHTREEGWQEEMRRALERMEGRLK